jgi:hypothetical protein
MSLDIRLTKSHLADRIRRRLGHPVNGSFSPGQAKWIYNTSKALFK